MANVQIVSPLPGVFYDKSAPDQTNYKVVGDKVAPGDVVGLVEVMKSFHEVSSEVAGTVTAVLVENEDAVMPGQPLFEIEE